MQGICHYLIGQKLLFGVTATVAAVVVTVATGGAALPVLAGVAASTVGGQLAEQLTAAFLLEAGKVQERLLLMALQMVL